jgi:hypothetical protein
VSVLSDYIDEAMGLPEDVLLGTLAFFTVPEGFYDRAQIVDAIAALGLDPQWVRPENKPLDAWKKAVRDLNEYTYPTPDGRSAIILIRDVEGGKESMLRLVVREIRDSSQQTLTHDVIGEIEFFRPQRHHGTVQQTSARASTIRLSHKGKATRVEGWERPYLDDLNARYQRDYVRYRDYQDAAKVRWMLRDSLRHLCAGVPVRNGTYFVPTSHAPELARWRELMEGHVDCHVFDRNGAEKAVRAALHRVPLVALQESKDMLLEAVEVDAVKQLDGIMDEIRELREKRQTITANAYNAVRGRFDAVMAQAKQYTEWLEGQFDDAGAAAEMAQVALKGLQRAMLEED